MGLLRSVKDKAIGKIFRNSEYESRYLRNYFKKTYDIDVGLYTIGAFDRWRIPPGSRIGRYCSIARTARLLDANHPISNLSTHPYFYLSRFSLVKSDLAVIVPPVIEDDVWIGHNAVITPECHRIGRGAVIGAGAVVMNDVPPYAVMIGAPARLARFRFDPDTIAIIEATKWWTLDREQLAEMSKTAPEFFTMPGRSTAQSYFQSAHLGTVPPAPTAPVHALQQDEIEDQDGRQRLESAILALAPTYTDAQSGESFTAIGLDSFNMIELRLVAEDLLKRQIRDLDWSSIHTPQDYFLLARKAKSAPLNKSAPLPPSRTDEAAQQGTEDATSDDPSVVLRKMVVNMPQMAQRGLSESWLFKELGDVHWQSLTQGLGVASADIADSEGNRLYATFTRIRLALPGSLRGFRENEPISLSLTPTRYGAGMFFGSAEINGRNTKGTCQLMTSFSKFGEAGSNTSLLKGQPIIPEGCVIRAISSAPDFAAEYRKQRSEPLGDVLFETQYDILPPHDINGVGLLYFAAYPMITDLCGMRWKPEITAPEYSTTLRDVYYFANAMPDEKLIFRIHQFHEDGDKFSFASSISRASDNVTMNFTYTEKTRIASLAISPAKS